ncbi:MAG: YncE family protein, partial [bacterium]
RAYITNYGSGAYNTITVVDLVTQKSLATIDLGALRGPHGIEFANGKVWFTAEAARAIASYDPATQKIDWILGTGQNRTHMLVVAPDGKRILTTNVNSATVTVIEQTSVQSRVDYDETVIPVGNGAEGIDVSPDGKEAWVANAQDGTISVIDLVAKRVVQTLDASVRGANRLKFTPDGTLAFVTTLSGPDVTVLDVKTRAVAKRIPVGRGAAGIQMLPDGARAFIACTPENYIAIIDIKRLAVVDHLAAGRQPDGLAWAIQR